MTPRLKSAEKLRACVEGLPEDSWQHGALVSLERAGVPLSVLQRISMTSTTGFRRRITGEIPMTGEELGRVTLALYTIDELHKKQILPTKDGRIIEPLISYTMNLHQT